MMPIKSFFIENSNLEVLLRNHFVTVFVSSLKGLAVMLDCESEEENICLECWSHSCVLSRMMVVRLCNL